jgi:hypothetical protein
MDPVAKQLPSLKPQQETSLIKKHAARFSPTDCSRYYCSTMGQQSTGTSGATAQTAGYHHHEWRFHSHAWHMGERFLVGYPVPAPGIIPRSMLSPLMSISFRERPESAAGQEFGFTIYPTIAEALRCGGKQLAVDAVLIIGEHGNYPKSDWGQKPNIRAMSFSNK